MLQALEFPLVCSAGALLQLRSQHGSEVRSRVPQPGNPCPMHSAGSSPASPWSAALGGGDSPTSVLFAAGQQPSAHSSEPCLALPGSHASFRPSLAQAGTSDSGDVSQSCQPVTVRSHLTKEPPKSHKSVRSMQTVGVSYRAGRQSGSRASPSTPAAQFLMTTSNPTSQRAHNPHNHSVQPASLTTATFPAPMTLTPSKLHRLASALQQRLPVGHNRALHILTVLTS